MIEKRSSGGVLKDVARLLMPRLNCHDFLHDAEYHRDIERLVGEGVGGFVLFEGSIEECSQTCDRIRSLSSHPLLLAADCEFGTAMRFSGGTEFPPMMGLASAGEPSLVREVARGIAQEMMLVGLDWNLAPVLDVTSNPRNPIVSVRSFSEVAEEVASLGTEYIRGTREGGVLSCGKHAPGHGDTETDSHLSLPSVGASLETLRSRDLLPFSAAVEAGVSSIMTGHLAVEALGDPVAPVSLSATAIRSLRELIGFDGALISDALDMGALSNGEVRPEDDPCVRALCAGNDIMEIPSDPFSALESLRKGVVSGWISQHRVSEAFARRESLIVERTRLKRVSNSDDSLSSLLERNRELASMAFSKAYRLHGRPLPDPSETGSWHVYYGPVDRESAVRLVQSLEGWLDVEAEALSRGSGARIRLGPEGLPDVAIFLFSPRGGAGRVVLQQTESRILSQTANLDSILVSMGNPYVESDRPCATRVDLFSSAPDSLDLLRRLFTES